MKNISKTGISQFSPKDAEYARDVARKINYLFDHFLKTDGNKYTFMDIEVLTNGEVSNSWLSKLSTGQSPRPGLPTIAALNKVFKVDPGFWFKFMDEWLEDQQKAKSSGELAAQQIALRARELPPQGQQLIIDLIEAYEKGHKKSDE